MGTKQASVRLDAEQHAGLEVLASKMSTEHVKASLADALRCALRKGLPAAIAEQGTGPRCPHKNVRPDPEWGGHICHDCRSHVIPACASARSSRGASLMP